MAKGTTSKRRIVRSIFLSFAIIFAAVPSLYAQNVAAAACVTPSTNYGQVSGLSATIDTAGTYRIWTRMAAENTSNNTYLLEVDGSTCFNVGGSSVPVYTSGSATRFGNTSSNWINTTSTGSVVSMTLGVGTHTFKLIGNAPGVVVDRIIVTSATSCTPTGVGANCADTTAPTLSAITASSVTHQAATVTWTTNDASTTQVDYGTTTSYGSSTALNSSLLTAHTASLTGLTSSTLYHYRVTSRDEAGNVTVSADRTFTTAATQSYIPSDIDRDGVVGILDVSLIVSKWNVSGTSTALGRSDVNLDGVVNALDLSIVLANYNR